jgi:hypothetical protein
VSEAREAESYPEPDQDFWDFVFTQGTPGRRRVRLDYMHSIGASYQARAAWSLTPSEYVKRNFAITTSGMNWAPVLRFCVEAVGADNIMFAIDYPYQTTEAAVRFLDEAEISDEDRRKIYHRNAERIFGIPDCEKSG